MNKPIIVKDLSKTYRVPLRKPGLLATLTSLTNPTYQDVNAVRKVSFQVTPGEIVGFIGPNGAGKTTTLKVLAGLLYPTSGHIEVAGRCPWHRSPSFLKEISLVMGNKNQLTWDNTVADSFFIHKEIYSVSNKDYQERLAELIELLDIEDLLAKQARNLSLGERAKCQLAMALLHRPQILFLDEPTLGLDVSMQLRFRKFIKEYNQKHNTTILLTSHYMGDIVSLCSRVLLINNGGLLYDGELEQMAEKTAPFKLIKITTSREEGFTNGVISELADQAVIVESSKRSITLRLARADLPAAATKLLKEYPTADISITDPPIEAVIDRIYQGGVS